MTGKAQTSLEYLMTYGWALILIAAVLGVLVFIVSNPASGVTFSSSDPTKIMLKSGAIQGTDATAILQNITGGRINITGIVATGASYTLPCTVNKETTNIDVPAGSTMELNCLMTGEDPTGAVTIAYTDFAGLQRTVIIRIGGGSGSTGFDYLNDPNLVSIYLFEDAGNLGYDYKENNHMGSTNGTPAQSTNVPAGFSGYSVELDVVTVDYLYIESGFTFDPSQDHTLCFWANPDSMGAQRSPFGQKGVYDNLTSADGTSHRWIINQSDPPNKREFAVANVYSLDTWMHICQTYDRSELTRTIVINGVNKYTQVDDVPINSSAIAWWCISAYGGLWNGYLYKPIWFDRILLDDEINSIYLNLT